MTAAASGNTAATVAGTAVWDPQLGNPLHWSGHVFGRLGQGRANAPGNTTAYSYEDLASLKTSVMISIFPDVSGDPGIVDLTSPTA